MTQPKPRDPEQTPAAPEKTPQVPAPDTRPVPPPEGPVTATRPESTPSCASRKSTARMAFQTWMVNASGCRCAAWPKSWIESPLANMSMANTTAPIRASVAHRACMSGANRAWRS